MNSALEALAVRIQTDLLAIDGTGVYTNTVRNVSRDLATPEQLKTFPSIVMIEEDEVEERAASTERLYLMQRFTLALFIETTPGTAASTTINSLIADVKYAMISDANNRHGSLCYFTRYAGKDPVAFRSGKFASAILSFDCLYSHTWDQP